ncbi:MAG: allantoinase AllB [Microlunatus sp.]
METLHPRRVVFRSGRTFIDGGFRPATILVENGVIADVIARPPAGVPVVEVPDQAVLLPGLVDTHVHVNEPGRTEWEGFASATAAAAAAGTTTVVDMPLNSIPPTISPDALATKRAATAGKLAVDVGFWGGVVPGNLGALGPLIEAGVFGVKAFLSPSGVEEFGHLDPVRFRAALVEVAALDSRCIVHAEDPDLLVAHGALGERYADFLATRPAASEASAIGQVIAGAEATGARVHIVHLADADSLHAVRAARAAGLPVTTETCPHYLTLAADDVPDGSPEFKCCPPIRGRVNQDGLWAGVLDGTIDAIVSDHSPSTVEQKHQGGGDFGLSWGGIAGLQTALASTWTEAHARGIGLEQIVPLFTTGPAGLVGLDQLGRIAPGSPAHLVVFRPDQPWTVDAARLQHRNPISPWHGRRLIGMVETTYLRGEPVWSATDGLLARRGQLLSAR